MKRPTLDEAAADLQSISKSSEGQQMVRLLSRFELTSRVMQSMDRRITSDGETKLLSLPSLRVLRDSLNEIMFLCLLLVSVPYVIFNEFTISRCKL